MPLHYYAITLYYLFINTPLSLHCAVTPRHADYFHYAFITLLLYIATAFFLYYLRHYALLLYAIAFRQITLMIRYSFAAAIVIRLLRCCHTR